MSFSDFDDFEDFEKDLLRSAQTDAPTAASRAANRAAVMQAAGFAASGAAAGAAGAAGKTTATTTGAAMTAKAAALTKLAAMPKIVTLVAAGIVTAGVAVTAIALQGSSGGDTVPVDPSPSGSALVMPAAATSAANEADAAVLDVPPAPVSSATPAPEPPAPASSEASTSSTGNADGPNERPATARSAHVPASAAPVPKETAPPATLDPLAEETRLLEEARACTDRGDLACASAKLGEHRARYPRGTLSEEAALLRIQVARRGGDVEEARRLASELLQANPNGPYARRARAILDELSRTGPPDR